MEISPAVVFSARVRTRCLSTFKVKHLHSQFIPLRAPSHLRNMKAVVGGGETNRKIWENPNQYCELNQSFEMSMCFCAVIKFVRINNRNCREIGNVHIFCVSLSLYWVFNFICCFCRCSDNLMAEILMAIIVSFFVCCGRIRYYSWSFLLGYLAHCVVCCCCWNSNHDTHSKNDEGGESHLISSSNFMLNFNLHLFVFCVFRDEQLNGNVNSAEWMEIVIENERNKKLWKFLISSTMKTLREVEKFVSSFLISQFSFTILRMIDLYYLN